MRPCSASFYFQTDVEIPHQIQVFVILLRAMSWHRYSGKNVLWKGSEISKDEHLSALRQCSENAQVLAVFSIVHRELKWWRRGGCGID
jgi:hypothetical protein